MGNNAGQRTWVAGALLVALGGLLARASVLSVAHPFAPALIVAAAAAGFARPVRLLAAAAASIVAGADGGALRSIEVALAALACEFCLVVWRPAGASGWALLAGAATAAAGASRLGLRDISDYRLAAWGFETLLAAGAAPVFADALRAGIRGRRGERAAPFAERSVYAALLAGAALGGLDGWQIGPVHIAQAIGAGAALLGAAAGGPAFGAGSGAAIGVALGLGQGISAPLLGRYSFAGLLAGAFAGLGRAGAIAGFAAGQVAAGYYAQSAMGLNSLLWETGTAVLIVAAVPSRWFAALAAAVHGTAVEEDAEAEMRALVGRRLRDFARVFGELAQAFEQVAPAAQAKAVPVDESRLASIHAELRERACAGCPLHQTCWDHDFYHTHLSLKDLWTQVELQGSVHAGSLAGTLRKRCIRPAEIASTTNYLYDLFRVNRFWERRVHEGREVVSAQLRGMATIIERLAGDVERALPGDRPGPPPASGVEFNVQYGVARLAKSGSVVSGDTVSARQLDERRMMVVLSDGMGAGPKAALESRATVALLERLLEMGFAPPVAVQTINSILLLRSSEDKFATVDLLLLDLVSGRAEFIKIGASPSFIRRREQVEVIRSSSLPIGILSQVEVESTSRALEPGDWVVMATDGLLAPHPEGDGSDRVVELLRRAPPVHPQALAESLLAHMFGHGQGEARDDATVLALRLARPAGGAPGQAPGGAWAAAVRRRA